MTVINKNQLLFTPGPLTTSLRTKEAMLHDWGSWDRTFQDLTQTVCQRVLDIAEASDSHVCVPMQGSGTFAVEAALTTLLNKKKKILVPSNGAYCERIITICDYLNVDVIRLDFDENQAFCPKTIDECLKNNPSIDAVALVHCETSTGILNPLDAIAKVIRHHKRKLIIDAMSTFGAIHISAKTISFDALVASANKCLEGVPGMGFVICNKKTLETCRKNANSLCLDLYAQWSYMEKTRQWRFTPPTHVIAAFSSALEQYETDGGLQERARRYQRNHLILLKGMQALGFQTFLTKQDQSYIITTFYCPKDPRFNFQTFYDLLHQEGFIIYPGKLTSADTFRIGCIGQLYEKDMSALMSAIKSSLLKMKIVMPTLVEETPC